MNCKGKYQDVRTFMHKKNKDLSNKVDTLIKQISSGKANISWNSDSNSNWSDSMAILATAMTLSATGVTKSLKVNSRTSNTLVPPSIHPENESGSSLIIRNPDNSKIKAVSCGKLPLAINKFPTMRSHSVPRLARPLLSVSDITDQDTAVAFLKSTVLFYK